MRLPLALRASALLLLLACACSPVTFTTQVKGEAVVPGDPSQATSLLAGFPAIGSFTNLDFDQDQEFRNQGVTKEDVSSVRVRQLQVRVLSPETQDLSFLDELRCYARVGDQEVLIAQALDIAARQGGSRTLNLEVLEVELQPYVTAPTMSIVVRGKGRVPPSDVRLQAVVSLAVKVKLI